MKFCIEQSDDLGCWILELSFKEHWESIFMPPFRDFFRMIQWFGEGTRVSTSNGTYWVFIFELGNSSISGIFPAWEVLTDNGAQEIDPIMNYMDSDMFWDTAFRILNAREAFKNENSF